MKLKLSTSPYYYLIAFVIILDVGFFRLFNIPVLKEPGMCRLIIFVVSCALLLNCYINKYLIETLKPYCGYINIFMLYFLLFIVLQSFYGALHYGQTMYDIVVCLLYFTPLLLLYPVIYLLTKEDGFERLMKISTILVIIYLCIGLFRALIYNSTGMDMLPFLELSLRYGRVRQDFVSVGSVVFIYSFANLLKPHRRLRENALSLSAFLLIILYELYTNMTRMYMASFFIVAICMVLARKRPKNKQIVIYSATSISVAILYFSGVFTNFFSSFSIEGEQGGSTLARSLATEYFQAIVRNQPFFGLGFLIPRDEYYNIFFGPFGRFFLDDLGIRNMYYHFGFLGIVLVALSFGRMFYIAARLIFGRNYDKKVFLVGSLAYIMSSSISLSVFDVQRILSLVFFWAIFESEYYKYSFFHEKPKELSNSLLVSQTDTFDVGGNL